MKGTKKWNVFISHASEDKADVAIPIADALIARGVKVWLDKHELRLGHSLSRKIDEGLAESDFGVVILSKFFFAKRWTQRELAGLVARQNSTEDDVILPVWHEVDEEYVARFSPPLADQVAVRTSAGIEEVVRQILEVVRPGEERTVVRQAADRREATLAEAAVPQAEPAERNVEQPRPVRPHLDALTREKIFESWRLLHIAVGQAADLVSPMQYRPDFGFKIRSDEVAQRYLRTLDLSENQIAAVLSSPNPTSRSETFVRIVDAGRLQQVDRALTAFQNFVIENELLLPDAVYDALISKGMSLRLAMSGVRLAFQEPHGFNLGMERNEAHLKVTALLNVGMKELKRDLRSGLGINDRNSEECGRPA